LRIVQLRHWIFFGACILQFFAKEHLHKRRTLLALIAYNLTELWGHTNSCFLIGLIFDKAGIDDRILSQLAAQLQFIDTEKMLFNQFASINNIRHNMGL